MHRQALLRAWLQFIHKMARPPLVKIDTGVLLTVLHEMALPVSFQICNTCDMRLLSTPGLQAYRHFGRPRFSTSLTGVVAIT